MEKLQQADHDLYGNSVRGEINRIDELAGAASVLMGQSDAARPVVLIRGAAYTPDEAATIRDLLVKVPLPETDADLTDDHDVGSTPAAPVPRPDIALCRPAIIEA